MTAEQFIPKWRTLLTTVGQFVAIMAVLGPATLWLWHATDARAQAYIQHVVDQRFNDLSAKVDELTVSINRLVRGQTAENSQSAEAAKIGRQILCLQQLQADPASGTVERCSDGEIVRPPLSLLP